MLNNVSIMGRLTADPVLRQTSNNLAKTTFTIACDRDFKNKDGKKETDFINVTCWRQTAEFVAKFLSKGRMVAVTGRLYTNKWEDNEGKKHTIYEVEASSVYPADSKGKTEKPEFVPIDADDFEGELPF